MLVLPGLVYLPNASNCWLEAVLHSMLHEEMPAVLKPNNRIN